MKTDRQIQEDVMSELEWDPSVDATQIGVTVKNGVVTLSGQVDTYAKKIAAERATKRIKDVKGIAEDIIVKLPSVWTRSDAEIAEAALKGLKWDVSVPEDKVRVKVEDGRLSLEGDLDWEYQKEAARRAVENIIGVKSVTNLITVRPSIKTPVVRDAIKKALERSADIEAQAIALEAIGSKVILRGNVRSWNEMSEVESAAWSAPGVMNVENKLAIA